MEKRGVYFESGNAHDLACVMNVTLRLRYDQSLQKYYGRTGKAALKSRYSLTAHHQQLVDLYQKFIG